MICYKKFKDFALVLILLFLSGSISFADEAVFRKTMENGLIFLIKESPPSGMVSINVAVKAGITSEEKYTASGISHLVEHMVFKGTKTRKPGEIESQIRSYGGFLNGAVSSDITIYQLTVPPKYLANALAILKDMLMNATFDRAEIEKEREVITKEIKLNEDDPLKKSIVSLFNNAYLKHPYKYPGIGYEALLKSLTREDLIKYYNRAYVPNRIVISVVGDIDKDNAASKIESEFKYFKQPDYGPVMRETEPPQIGRKNARIEDETVLSYLQMGFHSTSILSKDLFALDVLSMILGRGDNSRLNKLLVKEKRKAYSVSSWNHTPQDPGLFVITAVLAEDNINDAQALILTEINKIQKGDITDKEIETAKRMVLSDYIMSRETIEEQARDLSECEMLTGDYDFFRRYVEGVRAVNKMRMKLAALRYLTEDNLTVVSLVPKGEKKLPVKIEKIKAEDAVIKHEFPNGLKALMRRDTKIPAVSITVAFSGGLLVEDKNNNGISNFTATMLLKGTKNRTEADIEGAVENLGGEISAFSGFNSLGLNALVMKNDISFALELIKDIMTNSVFPQKEIDIKKSLTIAGISDEDNDIFQKGLLALRNNLFQSHPYAMRYIGEEATIGAMKRDDIVKFYETYCVANNAVISISGDIEPAAVLKRMEELSFGDIGRKEIPVVQSPSFTVDKIRSQALKMNKEESLLVLGFKTVGINSPDRYALDLLEAVLSGSSGRLFRELRDKAALAYTLGCAQKAGTDTGFILFYIATTKDKLGAAKASLIGQLKNVRQIGVGDDELSAAKKEIILNHKSAMQANSYCSLQSALDELYGLGCDDMYRYEKDIEKVTKEDVKRAAEKYLTLNAYAEVVIQPD